MTPWLNFLSLVPATTVTVLLISIAFLRFYNEQDFTLLGLIANPRTWSNRLTVAALVAAIINFCIEWDGRNREANRLAEEAQRRLEEEQRRLEEEEQASRRVAVEVERDLALLSYLANPSKDNQRKLTQVLTLLNDYRDSLG
ncbi:hypothetical protein PGN35_004585 [Nodosilinea sp. PGN35]|uniref:hypothetical protein n=1 Tax=Nodosilinea sp. PGN35 TaxID=3020489 RepID=UPI0023B308FD|nr:hypothetical protein [Nodosilinea sp. TSF1-S3]MDF0365898.1 hypothetical protein [Nodosilinea sp. TSF1-S3]